MRRVHVYPLNDWIEHVFDNDRECPCEPTVEWLDPETGLPYSEGVLVLHNVLDGRDREDLSFIASVRLDRG